MPLQCDIDYFLRRAADEIEKARMAEHSSVAQAHYRMASCYLERIAGRGRGEDRESVPLQAGPAVHGH